MACSPRRRCVHELVHGSAVECQLLGGVFMILRTGHLLAGTTETHRLCLVWVVGQQLWRQAVHGRWTRHGSEGLAVNIGGVRVRAEVVVERHVLLEDHHQVMNWVAVLALGAGFPAQDAFNSARISRKRARPDSAVWTSPGKHSTHSRTTRKPQL